MHGVDGDMQQLRHSYSGGELYEGRGVGRVKEGCYILPSCIHNTIGFFALPLLNRAS